MNWFFDVCSYDLTQPRLFFYMSWLVVTLQFSHFISGAYLSFRFSSTVLEWFFTICEFVTEFPLIGGKAAYYLSLSLIIFFLLFGGFTAFTTHKLGWTWPIAVMRYMLFSMPSVLYMPIMIPHIKMAFGCVPYPAGDFTLHPFYPVLTCWQGDHALLMAVSLCFSLIFFYCAVTTAAFFYEITPPAKDQVGENSVTARVHNRVERYVLVAKTLLLVLFVAGPKDSWRAPLSVLLFAAGACASALQVQWVPWWDETAQTCHLYTYLVIAWTGVTGFLMTILEGRSSHMLSLLCF